MSVHFSLITKARFLLKYERGLYTFVNIEVHLFCQ